MITTTKKVGADLQELGGYLKCTSCDHEQSLGDVPTKLAAGWPKHCGYTMTWITENMVPAPTSKEEQSK